VGISLGTCVGYDWDLPSPSYSYQIHFIRIKGVWHTTLYVVGSHKTVSLLHYHHNSLARFVGESVDF